jgi:hypothetical protein
MRSRHVNVFQMSRRIFPLLLVAVVLSACTVDDVAEADPTPTLAPPPTAAPGELTVGDLIARVDAAWPMVTSMRTMSTSGPVPSDDPSAAEARGVQSSIEEVVAPGNRRIVRMTDEVTTDEQIYVEGKVYMYGVFVASAVAPEVGPTTWITVDPSVVPADTPVGYQLSYLMRPNETPFGSITDDMRQRPAAPAGQVQVGGRTCTVYTFTDATQAGDRVDYELALDENDLPCQLVQRAGGFQNSSVFEINVPDLRIMAPDTPTPVSGTPEG